MFSFNFPMTRFVVRAGSDQTRRGQADQIVDEAAEAFSAALHEDTLRYVEELMDTIQACETALHEFDQDTLDVARSLVIRKNEERGYYAESAEAEADNVAHPAHYPEGSFARIEAIVEGLPAGKAVCLANVIKYAIRAGSKGSEAEDLAKARNYAHRLVTGKWEWE